MPSTAIKTSGAVASLFRAKRKEFGFTLAEVSKRLAETGEPVPISTLSRIEQGKFDPGVRRLHALLRLYRIPPHLVADLVELESAAAPEPPARDLDTLHAEGLEAWRRGDIAKGLSCFFAMRKLAANDEESRRARQKATLAFAIVARNLGKFRLAKQVLDDLLCDRLDPQLVPRVLVLGASVWRGLGSIEMAFALVSRAAQHLKSGDRDLAAFVRHQQAKLHFEVGDHDAAAEALDEALRHYRKRGDSYGEGRARTLQLAIIEAEKGPAAALKAARALLRFARENGHDLLVMMVLIEMGRLLLARGDAAAALDALREALADALRLEDKNGEFHAHYRLHKTFEALGDSERARLELEAARYFVRFVDDAHPEADEVREGLRN